MRICFVSPARSRRSGSVDFIIRLLRTIGEVVELHADGDGASTTDTTLIRNLATSRFDRYIYWRSAPIARCLLPLDLGPSFLVPTHNALAARDDSHWLQFVNCHFLSFNRAHHQRLRAIGCVSSHFQYFPDPGPEPHNRHAGVRSGFLRSGRWEEKAVLTRCRELGIERLHIHDALALDFNSDLSAISGGDIRIDRSDWFERREAFEAVAGRALFFFTPAPSDGVGLACAGAMARGQVVVSPNSSPVNEYIAHRCSGLLIEAADGVTAPFSPLATEDLRKIGHAARHHAVEGRHTWLSDRERLLSIVKSDGRRWSTSDSSASFGNLIRGAARERWNHDH